MQAIRTANTDIIAPIRGSGSDEQFSVFENPDLLRAWFEKRAYRVAGIGHFGNSTALDFAERLRSNHTRPGRYSHPGRVAHTSGLTTTRRGIESTERRVAYAVASGADATTLHNH